MRAAPLTQSYDSRPDLKHEEDNSRPPDAAIRANTEIIGMAAKLSAMAMAACASRGGLNVVIDGSNPGIQRAPEKISGQNGEILSKAASAGALSDKQESSESSESEPPKSESEKDQKAPAPQSQDFEEQMEPVRIAQITKELEILKQNDDPTDPIPEAKEPTPPPVPPRAPAPPQIPKLEGIEV